MEFTVSYFEYSSSTTGDWGKGLPQSPSQKAWSCRCSAVWTMIKVHAETSFAAARTALAEYLRHGDGDLSGGSEWGDDGTEESASDGGSSAAEGPH